MEDQYQMSELPQSKLRTLEFSPVEPWRAEETIFDGGEPRPPVVRSVGRARRCASHQVSSS